MERVGDTLSGQAGLLVELMTTAIEPDLQRAGISLATFELLSAIQGSGRRASQIEVARRLGISAPSLSESVQSAVRRGLITQTPSQQDARVKEIALTPKGKKAVTTVLAAVNRVEQAVRAQIEPEELERTVGILRRINGNLARILQSPTP